MDGPGHTPWKGNPEDDPDFGRLRPELQAALRRAYAEPEYREVLANSLLLELEDKGLMARCGCGWQERCASPEAVLKAEAEHRHDV